MDWKSSKCTTIQKLWNQVLHQREDKKIGKFDSRVDEGIFVGYSSKRKAYKCYNLRLNKIIESINVKIDETRLTSSREDSEELNDEEKEVCD